VLFRSKKEGIKARVVSMPSMELFDLQDEKYKNSVLPADIPLRIAIEAGIRQGWEKYLGFKGNMISIETFGASAPYETLYEKYGLTAKAMIGMAKDML